MYSPPGDRLPWLVCVVGGRLYEVRLDLDNSVREQVLAAPISIPDKNGYSFKQTEEFLVIQPGDGVTNPLFYYPTMPYTGAIAVRQSRGYVAANAPNNEIPAATAMDYYAGRLWYARGRTYSAGDVVGNQASGTLAHGFRDSVLAVTENPLAMNGDGFTVPAQDGDIRALAHTANTNATLGEGTFYIFTRKNIYTLDVPVSRVDWINTTANTQPRQKVAIRNYGTTGDRCVVPMNSDLYYGTMEPGIRSLALSIRYANQWGNTPISANVDRLLKYDDRTLLRYRSGMEFSNRLWMTAQPTFIANVGAAFRGVTALDFDLISNLADKIQGLKIPAWEGSYDGLDILQLFKGDFGGRDRAFAVVFSRLTGAIELWELTDYARRDGDDAPITWYFETPSYTFEREFSLKELDGAEIWVDQLSGTVQFDAYYRPDQYNCWIPWISWDDCAARNCAESTPACDSPYPTATCDQYRAPYSLPKPGAICIPGWERPSNRAFQFQFKLVVRGWCRIRGVILYALPRIRQPRDHKQVCNVAFRVRNQT